MSRLSSGACHFGRMVERRKVFLLSGIFLSLPLLALILSAAAPSFGQRLFAPFCHQFSGRSLHFPETLPLCARCFGLYLGLGLGGLFLPALATRFSQMSLAAGLILSPTFLVLRAYSPMVDSNAARLAAGLLVGTGVALFLKSALHRKPLNSNKI